MLMVWPGIRPWAAVVVAVANVPLAVMPEEMVKLVHVALRNVTFRSCWVAKPAFRPTMPSLRLRFGPALVVLTVRSWHAAVFCTPRDVLFVPRDLVATTLPAE